MSLLGFSLETAMRRTGVLRVVGVGVEVMRCRIEVKFSERVRARVGSMCISVDVGVLSVWAVSVIVVSGL